MRTPESVGEVMSRDVVTLSEGQDLRHLEEVMRVCRFRHMPVTDEDRLVGLLSHRDILRISSSSLLPRQREQNDLLAGAFRVRDVMVRNPRSVNPETPLTEAAHLMQREKLGCLPVVDEKNRLVGILTEADFVRLALELLQGRSEPGPKSGTAASA